MRDPQRFGASPPPRTADPRRRGLIALVLAALFSTACSDRSDPVLHLQANGSLRVQPSSIVLDDGDALDLSAVLRDASGQRVDALPGGATIQWTVVGTNVARVQGSGLSARVSGLKPGKTTLRASLGSLIATASLDVAPVPTRLEKQGPSVVLGLSGELAPHPARVQVIDRHGSPVADVPVSFEVVSGGGTIAREHAVSDAFGFAETPWILGPDLGLQTVNATVDGATPTQLFSYVNGDLASATLSAISSGGSVGTVGQALPELLEIRARDAQGRPVLGVGVEWVASAGALLPTSPVTDVQGRARARWILGPNPGLQTASARLIRPQPFTGPVAGTAGEVAITFQADAGYGVPTALSVAPQRVVLTLGNAARLNVLLQDALGNAVPGPYAASWSVLGADLVSLETHASGDAIVSGVRAGEARAVVTIGALTDTVDVIVQGGSGSGGGGGSGPGPITSLTLTPDTLFLEAGEFAGLTATARDAQGRLLANSEVEWSVDDSSIATVDAFGRVSASSEGTTRARGLLGGISAFTTIVVTEADVPTPGGGVPQGTNDLHVIGSTTTSIDLAFTLGHDGLGNPAYHEIRYAPTPMGWGWGQATRVLSGECASPYIEATVGARADCRIGGLQPGRSYDFRLVSWRLEGPESVFSPLSNIATGATAEPVGDPGVTIDRVIVSPSTGSIEPGEWIDLSAIALTTSGSPVGDVDFAWTSTNEAVATVDGAGRVTGVSEGAVTIRASASGRVGSASISVSSGEAQPGAVHSISVNPSNSNLTPGASVQLQASAFDDEGTQLSGISFTWSSSASSVASVDPAGRVTAHGEGSASISATASGITGTASVSVQEVGGGGPGPVATISISPGSATVSAGGGVQLAATARDASGTLIPGVNFTWSSSNSGVATVNGSGWVSGIGAGSVTITASASCCGVSGTSQLTVNSPVPPPPPPSGVWREQTWSFATQAAMLADPNLEGVGNAGGLGSSRPSVISQAGPWGGNQVLENYYGVVPADWQPQVGTNWYFPATETELWIETWIRFDPSWEIGPGNPLYPPDGNVDHKTIFIWEENWAQRWEVKFGPNYKDCVASAASHDISYSHFQFSDGRGQCDANRDVWDGQWHHFRLHVKMGTGNGRMRVWWDNQLAVDINGINTQSGGRRFMGITFGANRNQGTNRPMWFQYGPARIYRADPGW